MEPAFDAPFDAAGPAFDAPFDAAELAFAAPFDAAELAFAAPFDAADKPPWSALPGAVPVPAAPGETSLRDEPFEAVLEVWEAEGPVDGAAPCVPCELLPVAEARLLEDPGAVPALAGRFAAPAPACDDAGEPVAWLDGADPVAWLDALPGCTTVLQYAATVSSLALAAVAKLANATEDPLLGELLLDEPVVDEPVVDEPRCAAR